MPGNRKGRPLYITALVLRVRWPPKPSEGLQAPFVSDALMPQDLQIAIIRPHLEEGGVRPIPLIDNLLDHIL
jgi:hypothetical protein